MKQVQSYDQAMDLIKTEWEQSWWDKVTRWLISCMPKRLLNGASKNGQPPTTLSNENQGSTLSQSTKVPGPAVSRKRSRVANSAVTSKTSTAKSTGKFPMSKIATVPRQPHGITNEMWDGIDHDDWIAAHANLPLDQLDETDNTIAHHYIFAAKKKKGFDGMG